MELLFFVGADVESVRGAEGLCDSEAEVRAEAELCLQCFGDDDCWLQAVAIFFLDVPYHGPAVLEIPLHRSQRYHRLVQTTGAAADLKKAQLTPKRRRSES